MWPLILRLSGDYAEPSFIIDDVPMLTANPMSDRIPILFWTTEKEEACVSDHSSAESAESTSDSNAPGTTSSSSASGTSGDEASSPPASPESPATPTSEESGCLTPWEPQRMRVWETEQHPTLLGGKTGERGNNQPMIYVKTHRAESPEAHEKWEESDTAPTLDAGGQAPRTATMVLFTQNQRDELREMDVAASLSGEGSHQTNYLLAPALTASMQNSKAGHNGMDDSVLAVTEASTSSAEGSPARTSASPGSEPDSCTRGDDPTSSSSSCDSQMGLFQPEGMSSLRTYPDYFPRTVAEISPSFSRRWPNSGFTTSPTECLTADTSEFPSGGGESTSLADVLVDDAAPKYFLSPRAANGILRRARKRGRTLPTHLEEALERLGSGQEKTDPPSSAAPSSAGTPTSEATE